MQTYPLWKKGLSVGIILLFIGTAIIPSNGQTNEKSLPASRGHWLYVGGSGPGNYSQIQDAIGNASDGDTIFVFSGTYSPITINKQLVVIGENNETTIIYGYGSQITHNNISLAHFTFEGRNGFLGSVLYIQGDNAIVTDCIMYPTNGPLYAIDIEMCKNVTISKCHITDFQYWAVTIWSLEGPSVPPTQNCTIEDCYISDSYYAISIMGNNGHGHVIQNNIIYNCGWGGPGAGVLIENDRVIIRNCTFYHNSLGGLELNAAFNCNVSDCAFYENQVGCNIVSGYASGNLLFRNVFAYNGNGIYYYGNCNNNYAYDNIFINNTEHNAYSLGVNHWDNGYPAGGNYWSDYNGVDTNGDGIGDTPYSIPENNQDRYPHMTFNASIRPPTPLPPSGTSTGKKNTPYNFSTKVFDPNDDTVFYNFSWGDGSSSGWSDPLDSGALYMAEHTWNKSGEYQIRVEAKDITGLESSWSDPFTISISIPGQPSIHGPSIAHIGSKSTYSFVSTDPDGDNISYFVRLEPFNIKAWYGPYHSGMVGYWNYTFVQPGFFTLYILPKDSDGATGAEISITIRTTFRNPGVFLAGRIINLSATGQNSTFYAENVWFIQNVPIQIHPYHSLECITISSIRYGFITKQFVFGVFNNIHVKVEPIESSESDSYIFPGMRL